MINECFTPDVLKFLSEIEGLGFSLCLVGGVTRDYFYINKFSNDVDLEIRPSSANGTLIEAWPVYYNKLHEYFEKQKLSYTSLPYLITRVSFAGKNFEFSSPRTEINISKNLTHHHFTALLDPNLSYELSFKRRDFTINAIGFELNLKSINSSKTVDPYNGVSDLKNKKLKNITDDFFNDSVRFLRLIRFKAKFPEFVIDELLLSNINRFILTKLSKHHFTEELFKANSSEFVNLFTNFVNQYSLEIPAGFKIWTKYFFTSELKTKNDFLAFVYLKNQKDAESIASFFSLPEKTLRDLISFDQSYNALLNLTKEDFVKILKLPINQALEAKMFKDFKMLEDKKEFLFFVKMNSNNKKPLIDWSDWGKVNINSSELDLIEPQGRSFLKYYKTIKEIFSNV